MAKNKSRKIGRKVLLGILIFVICGMLFVLSSLSGLRLFIPYYPQFTGFPLEGKNYLVVFQNNNELRPGGGFISAYGILKFRNGIYAGIDINDVFGDIADHDYIKAPYPQKELLDGPFYAGYTFRDANYHGDFETNATELLRMFRLTDEDTKIDGVIAVNIKGLEDVLDILGEVTVWDRIFTAENAFELLEYSLHNIDHHNIEEIENRKGILGPLAKGIIKKAAFSPLSWREISDMIVKNLSEKHIQMHFFDSSLQKVIEDKGWSGNWPEVTGDFLAITEANLAGMKSDRYIKRNVNYRLQIWEDTFTGDHTLTGHLEIEMEHFGDYNIPISGNYSGYMRIYLPLGTKMNNANVTLTEENPGDHAVFGTIVKLEPGQKQSLKYEFELPGRIFDGESYHLNVVKQAGTINDDYSIVVEAPQGLIIQSEDFITRENFAVYENELKRDLSLDFDLLPDELGPRIAYTEIRDLNNILIVFNERVEPGIAADLFNVSLEDLDITNSQVHDPVVVTGLKMDYRDLWLTVEGMSEQPGEFYKLKIKRGYDLHGNSIDPMPKEVTLVQK